jgi:hypothetical protein
MSLEAAKDSFHYLQAQQDEGNLRWNKSVADVFGKLLGSGYIPSSIRSLWPLCGEERRVAVGYLLEVTERWRDTLRKNHTLEERINRDFLETTRSLFQYIEGRGNLPSSELFTIEGTGLRWADEITVLAQPNE